MTAVTRFFFRVPSVRPSPWNVLLWWEVRRPAYNLAVGSAGLLTTVSFFLAAGLPPALYLSRFFMVVMAYAAMANICYTLGPFLDILILRRFGPAYNAVGPTLFRYGFVFAVGLTLLPIPLLLLTALARLLRFLW